ncbi:alkaline phosphatase [Vibrio lentus]|nr:alkaline phosphatase [Vibrio lentus]
MVYWKPTQTKRQTPSIKEKTALYQLAQEGVIGSSLTHPEDAIVVDSACSATMLATGIYSGSEGSVSISRVTMLRQYFGESEKSGKATGLVSDTRLTQC